MKNGRNVKFNYNYLTIKKLKKENNDKIMEK